MVDGIKIALIGAILYFIFGWLGTKAKKITGSWDFNGFFLVMIPLLLFSMTSAFIFLLGIAIVVISHVQSQWQSAIGWMFVVTGTIFVINGFVQVAKDYKKTVLLDLIEFRKESIRRRMPNTLLGSVIILVGALLIIMAPYALLK